MLWCLKDLFLQPLEVMPADSPQLSVSQGIALAEESWWLAGMGVQSPSPPPQFRTTLQSYPRIRTPCRLAKASVEAQQSSASPTDQFCFFPFLSTGVDPKDTPKQTSCMAISISESVSQETWPVTPVDQMWTPPASELAWIILGLSKWDPVGRNKHQQTGSLKYHWIPYSWGSSEHQLEYSCTSPGQENRRLKISSYEGEGVFEELTKLSLRRASFNLLPSPKSTNIQFTAVSIK